MKKRVICMSLAISAAVCTAAFAGNEANPDAIELAPIPVPVSFTRDMDRPVAFDPSATVVVDCHDTASVPWLRSHFADWFGAQAPKVEAGVAGLNLLDGDEAYAASAGASGVKIAARTLAGVRWAAYTLRQLAIAKRGTFRTEGRILPTLEIAINDPILSRHHCLFEYVHGDLRLTDLASANGTFVNGEELCARTTVLRHNDVITVGSNTDIIVQTARKSRRFFCA